VIGRAYGRPVYDHDPSEVTELGWAEFIGRQWDAIFTGYRTGRGRRSLCRRWADLFEAGLGCSPDLADQLVRAEVLDRADRDLEGTSDPADLVAGMTKLVADVRHDLVELAGPGDGAGPGLLGRHAELAAFLREYAGVDDG
jgi:hypothetical protein